MCHHWQGTANENLKLELKSMTGQQRQDRLQREKDNLVEWIKKSAEFNSSPDINRPIGEHIGLFSGMVSACELFIDTIEKYIEGEDQITIPPNTIIIRR